MTTVLLSTGYIVLLAEQWEVGGDKPPPLGDGGTLERRDTQTPKETIMYCIHLFYIHSQLG